MAVTEEQTAKKGRFTALVIVCTALLWVLATLLGEQFDWTGRMRALFDFLALAGFMWSLVLIFQIWNERRKNRG
ncbi:MAG: DUF5337 domain-containing protein [Roseovarius sp.]|nr:DUF5337 domain-containing protein [Roseovarius sp.]MCY4207748.1 DUF5337 domain-containing protein [Roseovarius sp.]MCY4290689.1 DUF5337 domain-containing protein [Roseovarius sp.]MCY4317361.1 DUF5337 domain-containing protein [Roseovarius sp.]